MRKLDTSKRVTLPNRRAFHTKYKRVKRSELPSNIILRRNYRQRAALRGRRRRVAQQGRGIFSTLRKFAKNPFIRKLAKKRLSYAPQVYNCGVSKINNKTAKNILGSDAAKHLVNNLASRYGEWVVMVLVILI